jgi:hypothetical protein
MKTFKIAKKTNEVISTAPLSFISGGTSGNDLYVVVKKEVGQQLNVGGKLVFEKTASGNTGQMLKVCEESVTIKNIALEGDYMYVYFDYVYITPLILTSFRDIESPQGYKYKLFFDRNHNMLPCDLTDDYKVYIRRGENVIEFSDLAFCFPMQLKKGEDIIPSDGFCCDDTVTRFNYETMERNSILARGKKVVDGKSFRPEPGDQVLFATNPYFRTSNSTVPGTNEKQINLFGCPGENVTILRHTDFMGLGVVLEQDYDAKRMFQEYQVNELFVKKIKNSIIPDFIDLEKIKYAPAFIEEKPNEETVEDTGDTIVTTYLATGLTFNLHFRTRISSKTPYDFEDVWHLNDAVETWNGNGIDDTPKTREGLYTDENFVNSSNLIGYLGFTDDDIYNQKNRVKQSFIRLSFYDSDNPLTQNLLYYSTIFFDSGDLFGKYVKRKAWLEEEDEEYDHLITPVVWSPTADTDACSAVTSQLMVNDEYDMTRSGEGFNLYLFREDAPIENDPQDIYMKIEFNHAGIGRTVPLIYWPKEDDSPKKLTIENYLENLYIKVRIALTEKGYVYTFPNTVSSEDTNNGGKRNGIVWENERLVLNLFEPMIEADKILRDTENNG